MESLYAKVQEAVRKEIVRDFGEVQGKWNIISRPSKFTTVETMEIFMNFVIILHNMCIEESTADELVEEIEGESNVVVGGDINYVWCALVRMTGQRVIPPGNGSIVPLCETSRYMDNRKEHKWTKRLFAQR